MRIFQVGDVALPFWKQKLTDSYSSNKRGDILSPLFSHRHINGSRKYLHEVSTIDFEGYLTDTLNSFGNKHEALLRSYVGTTVNIIAYEMLYDNYNDFESCCGRTCNATFNASNNCVIWLVNSGVINNVLVEPNDDENLPKTLSFEIELLDFWKPLSSYFWDFGTTNMQSFVFQNPEDVLKTSYPTNFNLFQTCNRYCMGFSPRYFENYEFLYDKDYLHLASYEGCGTCCLDTYISDSHTHNFTDLIDIDNNYWSAPPLSIYIFEGFNDTQDIYIRITNYRNEMAETYIDIDATNTLLVANGYSILDNNDKIVIGDIEHNTGNNILRKSLIFKNGIITNIQPVMSYPDYFPAMIEPAKDTELSVFSSVDIVSYAHYFRRI